MDANDKQPRQRERTIRELMLNAYNKGTVIPAFNIPYLPIVEPVAQALVDANAFGLIAVAMCEWERFDAMSQEHVYQEYRRHFQEPWMRLHQDHIPVINEDNQRVDYLSVLKKSVDIGYDSIMVDGSRLELEENIAATKKVIALAAVKGVAVEAELGAVMGHEAGPLPPYEELFASGKGFTDVDEAVRFVGETGVDWLSVACGSIHGAIHGAAKDAAKVQARLNIEHLAKLRDAVNIPLVLHGGSGIRKESIDAAIKTGMAKINVGTDIRQTYEKALKETASISRAQQSVHERTTDLLGNWLAVENSRNLINPPT